MPILPLELDSNGLESSLFTIITTIGTPQDVSADELRGEAFFPANPATERFFRGVSSGDPSTRGIAERRRREKSAPLATDAPPGRPRCE